MYLSYDTNQYKLEAAVYKCYYYYLGAWKCKMFKFQAL